MEEKLWQTKFIKKQRPHFADKDGYSQNYGFYSSHIWMWELEHKESWAPMNWCFQIVVLEKIPESPLDSKIKQSIHKEINPEYSLEVEAPILCSPDAKIQLIGNDPDSGKDWGEEE